VRNEAQDCGNENAHGPFAAHAGMAAPLTSRSASLIAITEVFCGQVGERQVFYASLLEMVIRSESCKEIERLAIGQYRSRQSVKFGAILAGFAPLGVGFGGEVKDPVYGCIWAHIAKR